jgi:hypothetical protein
MAPYPEEVEQKIKQFAGWLSEKDRRRYAAVEALKLGHGGIDCTFWNFLIILFNLPCEYFLLFPNKIQRRDVEVHLPHDKQCPWECVELSVPLPTPSHAARANNFSVNSPILSRFGHLLRIAVIS